jgi:hypothetical protein
MVAGLVNALFICPSRLSFTYIRNLMGQVVAAQPDTQDEEVLGFSID